MKRLILFSLLLLAFVACNQATPEPTEPAIEETLALPTDTPTATQEIVVVTSEINTPQPTEEAATIAPPPTDPPPTNTPTPVPTPTDPPLPTAQPTVPTEVIIEAEGAILPDGFSMIKFADAERPVSLTFDDNGYLWTTHQFGDVWVWKDTTGDGRADFSSKFSFGFDWPNGVAIHPENGDVYVSQKGKISILRDLDGDFVADEAENFVNGLPYDLHWSNSLVFGPDGLLYMGLGSTCDTCIEVDERSATILRFDTATGESEIIATGLRNAFDVAFHPETGALFATENGRDQLGQEVPREELNHIVVGRDYGWPDCWDDFEGDNCNGTIKAIGFFQAHSSTNSLEFYTGEQFPERYRGKLFASVFGSWNYAEFVDQGIREITLTPDGGTYSAESTWFLQWDAWLLGLAQGPDGALYVGDYNVDSPSRGAIYRISYGLP